MQPVADPGRLRREIIPGLDQELELAACIVEPDRRQIGLPECHPGDRQRITRIGLAGPSRSDPLPVAELRWDLDRGQSRADQEPGGRRAVPGRALEADPSERTQIPEPRQQAVEPSRVVGKGPLVEHLPDIVDGARSQRRLVGIDANHAHLVASISASTMAAGQAGKCALR